MNHIYFLTNITKKKRGNAVVSIEHEITHNSNGKAWKSAESGESGESRVQTFLFDYFLKRRAFFFLFGWQDAS